MVLFYKALKSISEEFGIPVKDELAFTVDERKFSKELSAIESMPIGNYHHLSTHKMVEPPHSNGGFRQDGRRSNGNGERI